MLLAPYFSGLLLCFPTPFIKIKPPKLPRRLPKPLNRRAVFLLKEAAKGNRRYRAMIELLYVTGIRVSELSNIQCQDIYWEDNKIWIREAKARERFVYFPSECKAYLKIYAARRKVGIPWLFYNNRGKPLTRQGIWKIMKSLLIKAGLDTTSYTVHSLRHTFACELFLRRADILVIKQLLGHEDLSTTERYIKQIEEILKANQYP